ncbi:SIMPL domain-containing protein [Methanoregula sp.]|uniref:SIMPL domain-containing protein n=1 Tax=Methanoregula sp. TaxID=2052170 RepID=UPI002D80C713|nr:SIMPL domain-containing protein [Methanoregula sp.]
MAIFVLVLFTLAMIGCVAAADTSADHVISVSGSGTVTGTPDRVQISFAVQTQNADVRIAQANNALAMNNVMDALAAAGVPRDQMKTTGYTITPVTQQDTNGILSGPATSYQVTNTLQVTLKDTSVTGQVIDTAVSAGANQVNSIQFMLSDEQAQALRSQALAKAVANARADASAVAAALNVSITGTQSADISQGYTPVVYSNYDTTTLAAGKAAVPTPVQSGDITVTAQVTVIYTID